MLMATTALADITNKNGYEQLKDSFKTTAKNCSGNLQSFTMDFSFVIKDNGKVLQSENEVARYDLEKNMTERTSNRESISGDNYNSYYYSDTYTDIRYHQSDENYYVTEYTEARESDLMNNPFEEKEAEDIERIADALVGSLQEHVMVKENTDGSRELYGTLSEVQIPSLVNAVASLQMKQEFTGRQEGMPQLTQDIFIKDVTGSAEINPDGVLETLLATATLSGKDSNGLIHDLSVEVLFKLTNMNTTVISKPDLSGKKVVKGVGKRATEPGISNPDKYIGKYSNDIIIEKDGKFVKIGERVLHITHLDSSVVKGSYTEEYREGYEEYAANKREFLFEASFDKDSRNAAFSTTSQSGTALSGNVYIDDYAAKVHLYLNISYSELGFDSMFSPVLD
jgi:hypothetical protein